MSFLPHLNLMMVKSRRETVCISLKNRTFIGGGGKYNGTRTTYAHFLFLGHGTCALPMRQNIVKKEARYEADLAHAARSLPLHRVFNTTYIASFTVLAQIRVCFAMHSSSDICVFLTANRDTKRLSRCANLQFTRLRRIVSANAGLTFTNFTCVFAWLRFHAFTNVCPRFFSMLKLNFVKRFTCT